MENSDQEAISSYRLSYESLWKAIIRPPRDTYSEDDLCTKSFTYHNKAYQRTDYSIVNEKGLMLKCSFIEETRDIRENEIMPVVIYLHGNSSSRMEGMKVAPELLKNGINLFLFDFSGSGLSEGEYISLGWEEKEDLKVIIDFVTKLPGVGKIGLWGRSMGAATAMIYIHSDDRIKATVMDSPFADFRLLTKQLCYNYKSIPFWLVDFGLMFVKKTILTKTGLDVDRLQPLDYTSKTTSPGFFVHAMNDELIPLEHTIKLFESYQGEKSLNVCEGGHNTPRKNHILKKIGNFFTKHLFDHINTNN